MQGAWWYLVGDSPQGPVSLLLLEAMLQEGTITHESLIWKEGLSDWIYVSELSTHKLPFEQPQLPAPGQPADLQPASAWRRFFARLLDLWIISLLATALVAHLLPRLWPEFTVWIQQPFAMSLSVLVLFPLLLLSEAALFAAFGNTPGKALLRITVGTLDGQHLTGAQYLRRQLGVFWYGFAMGLPGIYLIAMASQGLRLRNGDPTAYDTHKFGVRACPLGWTRVLCLVMGTPCVLMAWSLLLPSLAR